MRIESNINNFDLKSTQITLNSKRAPLSTASSLHQNSEAPKKEDSLCAKIGRCFSNVIQWIKEKIFCCCSKKSNQSVIVKKTDENNYEVCIEGKVVLNIVKKKNKAGNFVYILKKGFDLSTLNTENKKQLKNALIQLLKTKNEGEARNYISNANYTTTLADLLGDSVEVGTKDTKGYFLYQLKA